MVVILLHSSKTMRNARTSGGSSSSATPALMAESTVLTDYLSTLSTEQIQKAMGVTPALAGKVQTITKDWTHTPVTLPAIDIFLGDIYSGLQVQSFTNDDRNYAHEHLYILSSLYGVLRALDEIKPYRLEMGYKLPGNVHDRSQPNITSLYEYWSEKIALQLPLGQPIINLSAKEYTKAIFPFFKNIGGLKDVPIISPRFLTVSPKTGEPTFVTVHAKIARGAFAKWLIQHKIEDLGELKDFNEIGYKYSEKLSTPDEPAFVAKEFKGIGLSVRLTK